MQIEKILDSEYVSEKKLGEEFYFVSSSEENSTLIKKLFLKLHYKNKFTSSVLTYGLLATLELSLDKNFTIIKQFMDKNNIAIDSDILTNALTHPLEGKEQLSFSAISQFMIDNNVKPDRSRMVDYVLDLLESQQSIEPIMDFWKKTGVNIDKDLPYLQTIYNFAYDLNSKPLLTSLDEQFNIINHCLKENMGDNISFLEGAHSSWANLKEDGTLSMCGCMGGELDKKTQRKVNYEGNPFLLHLKHFNPEYVDTFFNNNKEISNSLVTHAVVRGVVFNNDSVKYLFSQPQCADVIKNSPEIQNFITSNVDTDIENNKAQARLCLEKLLNNNELKSKPKL